MAQKILIVDDDEGLIYILKDLLARRGYEVIPTSHATQALKALKEHTFDLMIIDLKMPDMDGWHFIMKIRKEEQHQKVPIIVLSALLEQDADPGKSDLVNAYMVKPFEVAKLVEKIKELLKIEL